MVRERLDALRKEMKQKGLAYYLIFTNDFHLSEYVGEYFRCRAYFSGFTGSAGVLLVGLNMAGLWTDGRYFIQAESQLKGTGITLFRMGEEGVPTIYEYLEKKLKQGENLGFDARTIPAKEGVRYRELAERKGGRLVLDREMVDAVWKNRPAISGEPAFLLEKCYSGMSASEKLENLRKELKKMGAEVHVVSALDDLAWLFNIRGNDIPCNPVVLGYGLIKEKEAYFYTDPGKFQSEQIKILAEQGVTLKNYEDIFQDLAALRQVRLHLDMEKNSYALYSVLDPSVTVVDGANPEVLMKAVKNDTEIKNIRAAHVKDGLACTRFMRWIKEAVKTESLDEWQASEYLEQLRAEQEGFLELSFPTICAYNANGAMMHYSAEKDCCAALKAEGILLVDSGGQYLEGTTDVTRTFGLGPVKQEVKTHFTMVLKGFLHLQNAKFLYGCTGLNLDILARQPMWEADLDYKCGTGHGVGYLLNVHEAPNGFRWKQVPERNDGCVLEAGMVTTDEPGIYIEGSHGIRTENELLCRRGNKNEYGQYMYFEPLTLVPVDLDLVEESLLDENDKKQLNEYHQLVYAKLSPYMDEQEKQWLKNATRRIGD